MKATTERVKQQKVAEIKAGTKGQWRDLFRKQRADRNRFEVGERGVLTRMFNAIATYQALRRLGMTADAMAVFYTLMSSRQRVMVFDMAQDAERKEFARAIRGQIVEASRLVDRSAARDFAKLRTEYQSQSDRLRTRQATERRQMDERWQQRNDDRRAALAPFAPSLERKTRRGRGRRRQQGLSRSRSEDAAWSARTRPTKREPKP